MNNTIYGLIGHNGKLGRLLSERPNFVPVECDITNPASIKQSYLNVDVLVNCAGVTSIDECESNQKRATEVNVRGAYYLHEVYGGRVLTISSDHVFSGRGIFSPKEETLASPVNHYGWTKIGAEAISRINGGKVIRLSRSVSIKDADIAGWLGALRLGQEAHIPSFFYRNYLTQSQVVDGLEYFVNNFDSMPSTVHYGSVDTVSMYDFVELLARDFGLGGFGNRLVVENKKYDESMTPRPLRGGFSTKLAKALGFPMYYSWNAVEQLVKDANG